MVFQGVLAEGAFERPGTAAFAAFNKFPGQTSARRSQVQVWSVARTAYPMLPRKIVYVSPLTCSDEAHRNHERIGAFIVTALLAIALRPTRPFVIPPVLLSQSLTARALQPARKPYDRKHVDILFAAFAGSHGGQSKAADVKPLLQPRLVNNLPMHQATVLGDVVPGFKARHKARHCGVRSGSHINNRAWSKYANESTASQFAVSRHTPSIGHPNSDTWLHVSEAIGRRTSLSSKGTAYRTDCRRALRRDQQAGVIMPIIPVGREICAAFPIVEELTNFPQGILGVLLRSYVPDSRDQLVNQSFDPLLVSAG
jgi:hypothetical protein